MPSPSRLCARFYNYMYITMKLDRATTVLYFSEGKGPGRYWELTWTVIGWNNLAEMSLVCDNQKEVIAK